MANTLQKKFSNAFFGENLWIPIKISLKFVPEAPMKNIPALVQITTDQMTN